MTVAGAVVEGFANVPIDGAQHELNLFVLALDCHR